MKRFLQSNWPYLILIAALVAIFSATWGRFTVLPSPDSPPGPLFRHAEKVNEVLSGIDSLDFHDILELAMPPERFCDTTYPVDLFLIALAFGWFLRARGIGRTAAAFGGLVFSLMGYSLTLVSAGHRGFFFMTLYAVLMFAFLARGLAGRSPANFALAGCCAAWAIRRQTDFSVIYCAIAAIYTLTAGIRQSVRPRRLFAGAALAVAAFALTIAPTAIHSLFGIYAERKGTIEQTAAPPSSGASEEADAKWIFTTNWSLPPDEALEFVAPAILGRQTGDPALPYWGRLGRTWKWEENHQGFMNFRQHLIYIGAIPLSLALLALLALIPGSKCQTANAGTAEVKCRMPNAKFETVFWSVVWIVGLLLSFGRYTPFYRLFYMLPYISVMRAPVKFVRLVEFSTAALAAIGAGAIIGAGTMKRPLKRLAAIAAALAALAAVVSAAIAAAPSSFAARLAALGAGRDLVATMGRHAALAMLHTTAGFAIVAAIAFLRSRERPRIGGAAALAVLATAAALDFAIVERPFAAAFDMESRYTSRNPMTTAVTGNAAGQPAVMLLTQREPYHQALKGNLECHCVNVHPRTDVDHSDFFAGAGPDSIAKMAELLGCGFIAVPAAESQALPQSRFAPSCYFAFRGGPALLEKTMVPSQSGAFLARTLAPLPDASFFTRFAPSSDDSLLADLARLTRGPRERWTLPVVGWKGDAPAAGSANAAAKTSIESVFGQHGARRTLVSVDAPADGMILLHRPFWKDNGAWVDGVPAPQYKAGYSETAVFVKAGRHTVELRNRKSSPVWAVSTWIVLAVFAAFAAREVARP